MSIYGAAFGFGLVSAAVIAIAAVGFTMQFGIANLINLAYGEVMISSAFVAWALNQAGVDIWACLGAAAAFGAVLSLGLNRLFFTPFQRRGTALIGLVIVALAAGLMVSNVLLALVGPDSESYTVADAVAIRAGGLILTRVQIVIILVAGAAMAAVHALLTFTRLGKAMRATASNATLARNCGIPTGRVIDLVWLITGALCGIAGTVAAINSASFRVADGATYLVVILAAAVLGGAGQPYGAMLGALLIGEMTELSAAALSPQYKEVIAFAVLVAVMIVRPQGLLSKIGALGSAG